MPSIYSGKISPGVDYMMVDGRTYPITDGTITIPSDAPDDATVVCICSSTGWFTNTSARYRLKSTLKLCDSSGNNEVVLFSKTMDPNTSDRTSVIKSAVNISALKGKRIYAKLVMDTSNGGSGVTVNTANSTGGLAIYLVFHAVAGKKILAMQMSQMGTATSAGSKITNSNFSAGTKITASAFNSTILGI